MATPQNCTNEGEKVVVKLVEGNPCYECMCQVSLFFSGSSKSDLMTSGSIRVSTSSSRLIERFLLCVCVSTPITFVLIGWHTMDNHLECPIVHLTGEPTVNCWANTTAHQVSPRRSPLKNKRDIFIYFTKKNEKESPPFLNTHTHLNGANHHSPAVLWGPHRPSRGFLMKINGQKSIPPPSHQSSLSHRQTLKEYL